MIKKDLKYNILRFNYKLIIFRLLYAVLKAANTFQELKMKYLIDGELNKIEKYNLPDEYTDQLNKPYIEIMSIEKYKKKYKDLDENIILMHRAPVVRHCHMDVFSSYLIGTMAVPLRDDLDLDPLEARIYIDNNRLFFITDTDWISPYLDEFSMKKMIDIDSPVDAFFEFLDVLTDDEGEFIDSFEDELIEQENSMLNDVDKIPEDLENYLQMKRRELLILSHYYKQLEDVGLTLMHCPNGIIDGRGSRLFQFFSGRMTRLFSDTQSLREYALQIRDMYQSRIDVRQNQIMQVLTIITSTFMPLTLITGWYGMNFKYMPELGFRYGYLTVIILSLLIITIEWIIFKKKKWF